MALISGRSFTPRYGVKTTATIHEAIKLKIIEEFYVTLTSGTVVKGFKIGAGQG